MSREDEKQLDACLEDYSRWYAEGKLTLERFCWHVDHACLILAGAPLSLERFSD
jgi:hypothetical protein